MGLVLMNEHVTNVDLKTSCLKYFAEIISVQKLVCESMAPTKIVLHDIFVFCVITVVVAKGLLCSVNIT